MSRTVISKRRLLLVASATAAALGVGAALASWSDLALALFGVGGLAGFVWIVLWAQAVNGTLEALGRRIDATSDKVGKLPKRARIDELRAVLQSDLRGFQPAMARNDAAMRETLLAVRQVPQETVELGRVYRGIVPHEHPMPQLGAWAMTPATLVSAIDRIRSSSVQTIVECGSGSSTFWFATALEHRGGPGRIVALESSAEYAELTRTRLADFGLSHRAEVIHAPLVETALPGRDPQPWYDLSGLPGDLTTIDLLFVDGPIGALAPQVRYPGFPLLADRLSAGSIVILDDTVRSDEQQILQLWLDGRPAGRRLSVAERLDRSVVLTVDVEPG